MQNFFLQAVKNLYGYVLGKWPRIQQFIQATGRDYVVKKSAVFELEQVVRYLNQIDLNNCYLLVRGAIVVISYFGANRMHEIKQNMKWKGNY